MLTFRRKDREREVVPWAAEPFCSGVGLGVEQVRMTRFIKYKGGVGKVFCNFLFYLFCSKVMVGR